MISTTISEYFINFAIERVTRSGCCRQGNRLAIVNELSLLIHSLGRSTGSLGTFFNGSKRGLWIIFSFACDFRAIPAEKLGIHT